MAVNEDLGLQSSLSALVCGWIACAAALALLWHREPCLPGRQEVWQRDRPPIRGAERCFEPQAGQCEPHM